MWHTKKEARRRFQVPCSQQASTQRKIINLNLSQKMSFACSMPSTAFFGRNHIRSFARFLCWRGCSNIWTGNSFISLQKLKSNILKFNSFMLAVFILFSRCMKATNEKVSPFAQWNFMRNGEMWSMTKFLSSRFSFMNPKMQIKSEKNCFKRFFCVWLRCNAVWHETRWKMEHFKVYFKQHNLITSGRKKEQHEWFIRPLNP